VKVDLRYTERTTRAYAIEVSCPLCGALPGQACEKVRRRPAGYLHAERHMHAVDLGAPSMRNQETLKRGRPPARPDDRTGQPA
jgi:hypothetical protein